ncbi:DEAD/DEAH box helicase [Lujinxingia sediminis]|uniref:DEAD/DEAH box helicase n=1 Tax=Lujinxingia sediminis TaxID=2480984 RepID=A0ABY0CVB3_9DELT|nr:DEAD/DEAH box helicase [Lujinxingia sediminis]RVU46971.1 DEAD/DEAH box helicase [Lujinxingia sediminis]
MTIIALLTDIRLLLSLLNELAWRAFALTLDALSSSSPLQIAFLLVSLMVALFATACSMQSELNRTLSRAPETRINPLVLELRYTLPGIALRAFIWLITLPARMLRAFFSLFRSSSNTEALPAAVPPPVLVPTLGPSYLWAMLITAGIFLLSLALTPLLRWQLEVPAHFPLWSYLTIGHRPELAPFLPLDSYPWLATLLTSTFWLLLWWTCARIVRLTHWNDIGLNLIDRLRSPGTLTSWRTYFAASSLHDLDASFTTWARWLPLAAAPLLLVSFTALAAEPYRVNTSSFALALVALTSWSLHLTLKGLYRPSEPSEDTKPPAPEPSPQTSWLDVLDHLQTTRNLSPPSQARPPRPLPKLDFRPISREADALISPLLTELLPAPARLTAMQHDVLTHLSHSSFVHLEPPADTRSLALGQRSSSGGSRLRHRNQLVIAPEGAGKSTLGMLAALNIALTHTRSTLFIVRDDERARNTAEHLRNLLTPSTLRWNLRTRRIDSHLVEDLATGIIPDVLVCDLHELTTIILADSETFRPLLTNLGLVVVDELHAFCGPVEVHTQLAMRRLDLRLRALRRSDGADEHLAPLFLMLATETMDNLPTFARALCGVDAAPRIFTLHPQHHTVPTPGTRETSPSNLTPGTDASHAPEDSPNTTSSPGQHIIYDLDAFTTTGGHPLSAFDIIAACETRAVPWHWRTAGDDRAHLGRAPLPLREEPLHHVDDPLYARVVFIEGHATSVTRQLNALQRAGALLSLPHLSGSYTSGEHAPGDATSPPGNPVALITIIDPIERLALDHLPPSDGLAPDLEHLDRPAPRIDPHILATLPRPFLRPPAGELIRRHLASELTQHTTEVASLLDVFGNDIAPLLRTLARRGELLLDPRTAISQTTRTYEELLYVRALESSLTPEHATTDGSLPFPVTQVEVASPHHVCLRERTTLIELGRIDSHSARFLYYPGRIFESIHGRHIVVAYADDQAAQGAFNVGDVIVEPFLGDDRTSPIRRIHVDLIAAPDEGFTPERHFLGEQPLGLAHFPVQCRLHHRATRRLAPDSARIRERIYPRTNNEQPPRMRTRALGLFPNLEADASLTLASARLLAAALRVIIPLVYRGADSAITTALSVANSTHESSIPHDHLLATTDAIFFIDLHSDGNGASRSIERDGVSLLLRLAWNLLANLASTHALLNAHDDWDAPLSDEEASNALQGALSWLQDHIHDGNRS